jgi:hypothetical protein
MKNLLIKMLTRVLALACAFVITLGAMEKETTVPKITFMITNESNREVKFDQLGTILPNQARIFNVANQGWTTTKNPTLFIKMVSPEEKNIIVQTLGSNKIAVALLTQKITREFTLDPTKSYLLPLTITNDLKIQVGELEEEQIYQIQPIYELPEQLNPKKIIIKGRTLQLPPQELIKLRASKLEELTK